MDFFSAVADVSQTLVHNDRPQDKEHECFAEAIASRFGSGALLTTRLTPVSAAPPTLRLPDQPIPPMSLRAPPPRLSVPSHPPPALFSAVPPAMLPLWTEDSTTLILDIRAHAAYSAARLPSAVSLSVPSTLLKRPLFSLRRLAEMLPSANARTRFSAWRSASRILVYDADSSAIPESSNIHGLLRKFKNDGFHGELAWLDGGFQAVWREMHEIIDAHPPTPDPENEDEDEDEETDKTPAMLTQPSVLRTRHLPMAAFSFSSTTVSSALDHINPKRGPLSRGATFPSLPTPSCPQPQPAFNPFFDAVRQNLELSHGITERIPLRLPRRIRHRIHDLPFPWLREIARHAAKLPPRNRCAIDSSSSASEESEDDENTTSADVEEGKETLAMQFFKIEVAEQRRLMGIMEHHTRESMIVTSDMGATPSSNFPYSITAGVEKGAKNRYRHIWPFEHARVKLHQRRQSDDDYVNASYVQPIATNKQYIATQGPLPATFTDFWTLCWEQNVHVIVMLTREVENSMVKCGSYWTESGYGPLRLRLVSTTGASPLSEEPNMFTTRPIPQHLPTPPTTIHEPHSNHNTHHCNAHTNQVIRRVFELSHTSFPNALPRRIIHLQYLEWPDMNVPDDPRCVLELIRLVNEAVDETQGPEEAPSERSATPSLTSRPEVDEKTGVSTQALGKNRPVLLHCSAGVGRTGAFIAVDAILDAIRREVKEQARCKEERSYEDAMNVDLPSGSSPAPVTMSSVSAESDDSAIKQLQPMDTVSTAITAGSDHQKSCEASGYVIHVPVVHTPTPSSDGTDPEASGSDREIPMAPSGPSLAMQTRAWAENVSRAEHRVSSSPGTSQQHFQKGTPSRPNAPSSPKNLHLDVPSDTSNSSSHSLLDLSNTKNASGTYQLPQTSSFATSIAGVSSPEPSPPRLEAHVYPLSKDGGITTPTFLSVDHIPNRSSSIPFNALRLPAGNGRGFRSNLRPDLSKEDTVASQKQSGWLGEPVRNRSPSPMARTASGDSAAPSRSSQERTRSAKPSFTLRAPPYTGGVSSDAEPPSRSVSPSADEASVASQVSSYHSSLKNHHYMPLHSNSLPISLDEPDKGKSGRSLRIPALVPERSILPVLSSTQAGQNSSSIVTVDYKQPRPLHETATPTNLSTLEEPICELIQDMREQRMSLCQSLRQYVFVHAAVLEGALMIVDEERELMKQRVRERAVEMSGIKIEPERAEGSRVVAPLGASNGSSDVGCRSVNLEMLNKLSADPNQDTRRAGGSAPGIGWGFGFGQSLGSSDMVPMSRSTSCPSASTIGDRKNVQEGEGYFTSFVSQPPMTYGWASDGEVGVDGSGLEGVFSPRPRIASGPVIPPSVASLQRPRHPLVDTRFSKRSTSPSDCLRVLDDDPRLFKRPSAKRKQPSGEAGEIMMRKRAQNESSPREREKEREFERRLSNGGGHSHSRDTVLDVLSSGLVR